MKRRWLEFAVVTIVLVGFSHYSSHPEPNCTDHTAGAIAQPGMQGTVYLVPIGEFPPLELSRLITHYANAWHIPIQALSPLSLDKSLVDQARNQLVAERVVAKMKRHFADLSAHPNTVLIGITALDMYRDQSSWRYAFSHREGGRYAVVSSARMHPRTLPLHLPHGRLFSLDQRDNDLSQCRLTKMIGKNIGVLYYQLPMKDDPTSMLYDNIGGPDDLDRIKERF
ncbi:MAG: hypothetical protein FJ247_11920 [Nitrospira sp.]|nr:hypothetical protein [Nitrospira sp.]